MFWLITFVNDNHMDILAFVYYGLIVDNWPKTGGGVLIMKEANRAPGEDHRALATRVVEGWKGKVLTPHIKIYGDVPLVWNWFSGILSGHKYITSEF